MLCGTSKRNGGIEMKYEHTETVTITLENEEIRNLLVGLEILHGTELCQLGEYNMVREILSKIVTEDTRQFIQIGKQAVESKKEK